MYFPDGVDRACVVSLVARKNRCPFRRDQVTTQTETAPRPKDPDCRRGHRRLDHRRACSRRAIRGGGTTGFSVTLIESRQQPPIGVGEGTWPTLRTTLKQIGVTETDFLRACDASFKQGSQFVKWTDGGDSDAYYHPFTLPAGYEERNLAPYWLEEPRGESFAAGMCFQTSVRRQGLRAQADHDSRIHSAWRTTPITWTPASSGPSRVTTASRKLGVGHVYDEIVRIESTETGDISRVLTKSGESLAADLYIDCSGFSSLLIGRHFGVPFLSKKDVLFIDKAWAVQIPYPTDEVMISSVTVATAQSSGWVWRTVGHQYAPRRGVRVLRAATRRMRARSRSLKNVPQLPGGDLSPALSFSDDPTSNSGYREEFWTPQLRGGGTCPRDSSSPSKPPPSS